MKQAISHIRSVLGGLYPEGEIRALSRLIAERVSGLRGARFLLDQETVLNSGQRAEIEVIASRLANHEPIQYVLGVADFFGLELEVSPDVLIPRPETEELVEWILIQPPPTSQGGSRSTCQHRCNSIKSPPWGGRGGCTILDIGTGSGCIAVALAKHLPEAEVYALDVSEKALAVAKRNAERNGVNIHFLQADILELARNTNSRQPEHTNCQLSIVNCQFDIIVSNPPYITESERGAMCRNVLDHEPHRALFVPDDDPLVFYRAIGAFAAKRLAPQGTLYVEINRAFGWEVCELFRRQGFSEVELRKDLSGNDRMVRAKNT